MKIKISDMMDNLESAPLELEENAAVSAEGIKAAVRRKLRQGNGSLRAVKRISRTGIAAAVLAAVLVSAVGAAAVYKWGGFALTGGMSDGEIKTLLEEIAATPGRSETRDQEGNVHYLDETGKELLVLSAEEAAKYEQELLRTEEQAVRESTTLVDADTLPLMPSRITELEVGEDGGIPDLVLSNGSMVLLHPAGKDGYELEAGDTVTIELTASDVCYVQFGAVRDGAFVEAETHHDRQLSHTFTVEEAGLYCFYVEYYSSDASSFTEGGLTIRHP